jgi:hypothetical protein
LLSFAQFRINPLTNKAMGTCEGGNERTADADCRGGQFDVAWIRARSPNIMRLPPGWFPGNRNFLILWKIDLAAAIGVALGIRGTEILG